MSEGMALQQRNQYAREGAVRTKTQAAMKR